MSYFTSDGISSGPIKVCTTWIQNYINPISQTKYLAFSYDKNGNFYTPLMAGAHNLSYETVTDDSTGDGIYEHEGERYRLTTPLNAVVTVGFLSAYTAIAPGDWTFNPDQTVTKAEFIVLEDKVKTNTSKIAENEKSIQALKTRTSVLEGKVQTNEQSIQDIYDNLVEDWFKNGLIIQCGTEVN